MALRTFHLIVIICFSKRRHCILTAKVFWKMCVPVVGVQLNVTSYSPLFVGSYSLVESISLCDGKLNTNILQRS